MISVLPHNPENQPLAPGYRWLAQSEPHKPTDELFVNRTPSDPLHEWVTMGRYAQIQHPGTPDFQLTSVARAQWSLRRALCVDDSYAPPPDQWSIDGWEVVKMAGQVCLITDQYWDKDLKWTRVGLSTGRPYSNTNLYLRRKVEASAPSAPTLNAKREVVVYIGDSAALSNMLKAIFKTDTPKRLYAGYVLIRGDEIAGCNADSDGYRSIHYVGVIWIDAYTEMGKLVDLLPSLKTPAPIAPTINGYVAQYTKGSSTVTFGCAQISIELIKGMKGALNTIEAYGPYPGNRFMTGFVLNSGVRVMREDIIKTLAYIDQVNGADASQS